MFHLAKLIAQKVSNAPRRYEELMGTLTGILESLSEPVDGQIRDASGGERGRPRPTGNSHSAPAQTPCPLCSCPHSIEKCRTYEAFLVEKGATRVRCEGKSTANSVDMVAIGRTIAQFWLPSAVEWPSRAGRFEGDVPLPKQRLHISNGSQRGVVEIETSHQLQLRGRRHSSLSVDNTHREIIRVELHLGLVLYGL
jgi:hypothetical protein